MSSRIIFQAPAAKKTSDRKRTMVRLSVFICLLTKGFGTIYNTSLCLSLDMSRRCLGYGQSTYFLFFHGNRMPRQWLQQVMIPIANTKE